MNWIFGIENISFFDSYWALVHFIAGLLIGVTLLVLKLKEIKKYIFIGSLILILWEVLEIYLRYLYMKGSAFISFLESFMPESFFLGESYINIISDLVLGSFGLLIVFGLKSKIIKHE